MSYSWGAVKFNDGLIKYYLYNGGSDTCYTRLYNKASSIDQTYKDCLCIHSEDVEIYSDYGGGSYWKGMACKRCSAITVGYFKDNEDYDFLGNLKVTPVIHNGRPDWIDRDKINKEWWSDVK